MNIMTNIVNCKRISFSGTYRLGLDIRAYRSFSSYIQQVKGSQFCRTLGVWHLPFYDNYLDYLQTKFGHIAVFCCLDTGAKTKLIPKTPNAILPKRFIEQMRLKRYSVNTQKTYSSVLVNFLKHYKGTDPEEISNEQIREYFLFLVDKDTCSVAYQRQAINAIKIYYGSVLGRTLDDVVVASPRRSNKLPVVLSEEEVALLLSKVANLKRGFNSEVHRKFGSDSIVIVAH